MHHPLLNFELNFFISFDPIGSNKGALQIWSTVRWALVKQLPDPCPVVPSLAFIHNKGLAAGFANGCLRFWDTASWKMTGTYHDERFSQTAFNQIYMAAVIERKRLGAPWEKDTEIVLWKKETVICNLIFFFYLFGFHRGSHFFHL
jgi:hypothetical protein